MDKLQEEEEEVKEALKMVNAGVGPTSYNFLHSILSDGGDGTMSRVQLYKKRKRLDDLLIASPEQLEGMQIEVAGLMQLVNFCEARYLQALTELELHLSNVEKIAFDVADLNSGPFKFLKEKVSHSRELIATMRENAIAVSNRERMTEWIRREPGAVLRGKDIIGSVLCLQELNNQSKLLRDVSKELDNLTAYFE